jgi:hypothetical protein
VLGVTYQPGAQRLRATIRAGAGGTVAVTAAHRGLAPGALDALASALAGAAGAPRFVSGVVHRFRGEVVVEPLAVVAGSQVVVPDLAPGEGAGALAPPEPAPEDALVQALDGALAASAEVAHRGLRHLSPGYPARARAAGMGLRSVGLGRAAEALERLAAAAAAGPGPAATTAWADAHVRLLVTAERL